VDHNERKGEKTIKWNLPSSKQDRAKPKEKANNEFTLNGVKKYDCGDGSYLRTSEIPILAKSEGKLKCLISSIAEISLEDETENIRKSVPNSYMEAKEDPEWKKVSWEEVDKLKDMECFDDISIDEVPKGEKIIGSRMIYKEKRCLTKKGRMVALGYMQTSFFETYAPASLLCILRLMLIIAAATGMDFEAVDFSSAFINAKLEKPVYIRYPKGMGKRDRVMRVWRCIYGLIESARRWNQLLVETLTEFGFVQSKAFTSVFYHKERQMYVSVHVDDLFIIGTKKNRQELREFLSITKGFKITVDFEPKDHLGIEITRENDGSISINQPKFIDKMLDKFGMTDCNTQSTPASSTPLIPDGTPANNVPYRELVGTLIYLMLATRPDIAWIVKELARFSHAPTTAHWNAGKRLLAYLKKTKGLKITYSKSTYPVPVDSYVDSDWGGQIQTLKNSSCYFIYVLGQIMGWRSWTQKVPAHSSAESELVGMDGCLKETTWVRNGLIEIDLMNTNEMSQVHIDNAAAQMIFDAQNFRNVRHMDLKYQYSLHEVQQFKTEINRLSTDEMTADIGTKSLPKPLHYKHMGNIFSNVDEVLSSNR
jgi:hypothetical protein